MENYSVRIKNIDIAIKEMQDIKEELQNECPHTSTFLANYSWRPGVIEYNHMFCVGCNKHLGARWPEPNLEEIRKLKEEFKS